MAVPDFQSFFLPLLRFASDGQEHTLAEARTNLKQVMNISDEDLKEMLPSGSQTKFDNRVGWAKSFLVQAKVLNSPKRGRFYITDRGKDLLSQGYNKIDVEILDQYPEFVDFRTGKTGGRSSLQSSDDHDETPEETLQKSYLSIRSDLAGELLTRIKDNSPKFFEQLVVDLMIALGYGGSLSDPGHPTSMSGDEGIDGIIKEDKLGLDVIYLQAKKWEGSVGRPEIQKFVGALHGKHSKKGVFITTGTFTNDARGYVLTIDSKVILIDGRELAELMIDNGLGVSTNISYEIKKIDTDYFDENV